MADHRPTHQPSLVLGMLTIVSEAMRDAVKDAKTGNPIASLLLNWRRVVDWAHNALQHEAWQPIATNPPPSDRDVLLYFPPQPFTDQHRPKNRPAFKVDRWPNAMNLRTPTHWKELYEPEKDDGRPA